MNIRHIKPSFETPHKGSLLISEPYLEDVHFRRTVVLLSEHNEMGTVGFILNRLLNVTTTDVVPDLLDISFPVFYGGPVEPNTLHFIHKAGMVIPGSFEISKDIYWGGDIEMVNDLLNTGVVTQDEFRFFVGYSGWSPGQLDDEIREKAWWITRSTESIVFDDDLDNMWKKVVQQMGDDFAYMANSPEDPSWN